MREWLMILAVSFPFSFSVAMSAEKGTAIGFAGMEVYKLDWDTHNLRMADVNGDGLTDILVVNNARARIDCLLQRAKPGEAPARDGVNELPNDSRFENRPYSTEKRVFSMEVGDLNKDGRADMAYYGDPRELVVVCQLADGTWGPRRTFDIADGSTQMSAIAIGDFNGDGRNDVALLAVDGIYFIYQNSEGKLDAPVKEAGLPDGAVALQASDFNGERRTDLLYFCSGDAAPFVFRFQTPDGRLGPEVRCKTPAIRAVAAGDVDGDKADELVAIEMAQGRLVVDKVASETDGQGLLDGPFERYTLRASASRLAHAVAFAPIPGSKGFDILAVDPDAAEIERFAQSSPGLWNRKTACPTLKGVTDMALLVSDGKGPVETLVLSPEESAIGLAKADASGRLGFPRALPIVGKPSAMTVADLQRDGKPELLYASALEERGKVERAVRVLAQGETGWEEKQKIVLDDARFDPEGLLVADINQDGIADILVFIQYQEMRVLKGTAEGGFVDVSRGADYGKGLVQGVRLRHVALADVTGDGKAELLVAGKNYVRALRLDGRDRLEAVEQFNGRSPTSQIVGVAGADLDGDGAPELILADAANRCLTALKRDAAGAYRIVENFQTGPFSLERLLIRDLTGTGKPAIILVGPNDFTVLQPGRPKTALKPIATYETAIRNGRLDNIALGDLDGDGRPEFVVSEGTRHAMEVLAWSADGKSLRRLQSWPVFEAKSFGPGRGGTGAVAGLAEPREFDIADVTNDKKPDLVLLIHDRVLVYVQE